jgi:hypothetical protein
MSKNVLLISETKLKNFTTINQNVDLALLVSCIWIAQELGLQTLIGTKGYDYYMNLVLSVQVSGGTMSQPDRILLEDYIAPYLIHRAYFEAMPELFARKMNKAITVGNTEQGTSIDIKGMSYLRDIEQGRYEFYAQRMMDRLRSFPGDYPWYYTYSSQDGMPNSKQTYFAGIHIEPGLRYPPRKNSYNGNLPAYWGPEYSRCDGCGDY